MSAEQPSSDGFECFEQEQPGAKLPLADRIAILLSAEFREAEVPRLQEIGARIVKLVLEGEDLNG